MIPADILSLERTSSRAQILLGPTQTARDFARYTDGFPPPPCSTVMVDQVEPGKWQIMGATKERRLIVHDDFNHVDATTLYGDTPWNLTAFATAPTNASGSLGQIGAIQIATDASINAQQGIQKADASIQVPGSGESIWLAWRFKVVTTVANVNLVMGLVNTAITYGAFVHYQTGTVDLKTRIAGVDQSTVSMGSSVFVADTWYEVDLVLNDGWAGVWVDGSGPAIATIVPTTNGYQPLFYIQTTTAATRTMLIDYVHCERFQLARRIDLLEALNQ